MVDSSAIAIIFRGLRHNTSLDKAEDDADTAVDTAMDTTTEVTMEADEMEAADIQGDICRGLRHDTSFYHDRGVWLPL